MDFVFPADHRVKLKESEKKDKYLDLARELKRLWNMKVTVVPIVIDALTTVTKGLVKAQKDLEIRVLVETIQTTALLRSAWILRRVLETWNADGKNSEGVRIIIEVVIPVEIDSLGTVIKGLVLGLEDLEIRGWVETIQTIASLISARILRRVLETLGDLLSLKTPVKNLQLTMMWKTLKWV